MGVKTEFTVYTVICNFIEGRKDLSQEDIQTLFENVRYGWSL